ncbi:MAG: hypothetical protein ACD_78C00034G0006 [uncultured bacterium (gcode 4)]|uniref:Uncharacterized protein n=1 Tax=uncultured bacterium (gcode 4) TaxID=1234023 RepID=K1YE15_9BACT|nr:MAG: hypothetical protein ACD_78C00034G0006 [uncultured bacterium (gcode 4)]
MIENPFQPGWIPEQTYVKINLSWELKKALWLRKVKYIYWPSKVWKTTILSKVFEEERLDYKKVVCSEEKTADEIEREIFELKKISVWEKDTREVSGGGGVEIPLIVKVDTTIKGITEKSKTDERIIRTQTACYFWIDDFHLLSLIERNRLSARLKRLSEEGVNIVIVWVDHTRWELLRKVSDLAWRIEFIKADWWNEEDLHKIISSWFKAKLTTNQIELITPLILKGSFKNPQIVQDLCAFVFNELFVDSNDSSISDELLRGLVNRWFDRLQKNALDGSHSNIVLLFRWPDSRGKERIKIKFEGFEWDSYFVLFNKVATSNELIIQLDKRVIWMDNAHISNFLTRAAVWWIEQWNKITPTQGPFYYNEETKELYILDPYTILAMRWYLSEQDSKIK